MVPESLKAVALWYDKSKVATPPDDSRTSSSPASRTARSSSASTRASTTSSAGAARSVASSWTTRASAPPDDGGFADAFAYLKELKDAGAVFNTDGNALKTQFQTGEINAMIDGPWQTADFRTALGDNLAVAPIPDGPAAAANPFTGTDGWYINPNLDPEQAQLAVDVALALTSPASEQIFVDDAGHVPANPVVTITDPITQGFSDAAAAGLPRPQNEQFNNWWGPFGDALNKVIDTGADPATAVADACAPDGRGERPLAALLDAANGAPRRGAPPHPHDRSPERARSLDRARPGTDTRLAARHQSPSIRGEDSLMATTAATLPRRSRSRRVKRGIAPYLYLVPAFIVMGIITFYPLFFQVWMSFTDFGQINFRVRQPRPSRVRRPRQLHPDRPVEAGDPELRVRPARAVQPVLGVQQRRRPHHHRRRRRAGPERSRPEVQGVLPGDLHPPRRHSRRSSSRRSGGTCTTRSAGAINQGLQAVGGLFGIASTHPAFNLDWIRQPNDPISWIPLPLAFFAMLTANTWLGWPLNAVVATGALQSIPGELYEAAEMDGASSWQKFKNVTVVFLRPAMLPYAIYGFVITFNLFFLPFFMTAGRAVRQNRDPGHAGLSPCLRPARVRCRGGVLRLPVLPAPRGHADHEPIGQSDEELCRVTATTWRQIDDRARRRLQHPASPDPRGPGEDGEGRREEAAAPPPDRPPAHPAVHHRVRPVPGRLDPQHVGRPAGTSRGPTGST